MSNGAVVGRLVDQTGAPASAQFDLGETIAGNVTIRIVTFDAGRYAVIWDSSADSSSDIRMRLFEGTTPLGGGFNINETTAGAQSQVAVAQLESGALAVIWRDSSAAGDTIRGRIVSRRALP